MKPPEETEPATEKKDPRWPLGKPSREDLISFKELTKSKPCSPITRLIDRALAENAK